MSRWSDLATWRGPTPNQGGAMREVRGVVVHIAAGYFEGTISWQRNDSANVSSHFIVGRDGRCAQMVDTDITAWTQGDGNGHWLSVENEGFLLGHRLHKSGWHELSAQMIETNAQLLARAHRQYGVPLQLTSTPTGRGLGYHGMGAENGYDWGHLHCPGEPIKAQLPKVLARAIQIVNGDDMTPDESQKLRDIHYAIFESAGDKRPAGSLTGLASATAAGVGKLGTPPPATVDVKALAALLEPMVEAAAERAVRKVLGAVDGATVDN